MSWIASFLDSDLLAERGGRSAGDRVSSLAIAPYASPDGLTAAECGVHPHRAVVHGTYWEMDHTARSVVPGPPRGYHVHYRDLLTGEPQRSACDLVAAEHLESDSAPWETDTGAPVVVPAALTVIPAVEPGQEPGGTGRPDPLDAELRAVSHVQSALRRTDRAKPRLRDPAEKYRAAALARLWMLRDKELREVGDSTPRRVAERIANEPGYPQPADPPTLRQLEQQEESDQVGHVYGIGRRRWSSAAPPDRHLVAGRRREQLLQWLGQVTDNLTTARVCAALDGFTPSSTVTDARTLLAVEGFVQVADLHRNAGTPVAVHELARSRRGSIMVPRDTVPDPDDLGPGTIDLVFAHPADGHIATLHTDASRSDRPTPAEIRLWFGVLPLDRGLFTPISANGSYVFNDDRENTGIYAGELTVWPHRSSGGSLRVHLAGLRAFTIPAWTPLPRLWLGADSADQVAMHHELCDQARGWLLPLLPASPR